MSISVTECESRNEAQILIKFFITLSMVEHIWLRSDWKKFQIPVKFTEQYFLRNWLEKVPNNERYIKKLTFLYQNTSHFKPYLIYVITK